MAEIKSSNPINEQHGNHVRTRSKFDLSYHLFDTHRFGDITPHMVMDVVPSDENVQIGSSHQLGTYSLKAPLMQRLTMKKDYFQVPLMSLLPFNYDKFITNPVVGDDVNADAVGLTLTKDSYPTFVSPELFERYKTSLLGLSRSLSFLDPDSSFNVKCIVAFQVIMCQLLSMEKFFSNGSLLSKLGCHLSSLAKFVDNGEFLSFDQYFDLICSRLSEDIQYIDYLDYDGSSIRVIPDTSKVSNVLFKENYISFREFIEVLRDDPWLLVHITNCFVNSDAQVSWSDMPSNERYRELVEGGGYDHVYIAPNFKLNLARPLAYQMVCAHYYTNDKIDYIYSAELYREYIHSLRVPTPGFPLYSVNLGSAPTMPNDSTFVYNGVRCYYDHLSAFHLSELFPSFNIDPAQLTPIVNPVYSPAENQLDQNFNVSITPVINFLCCLVLQTAVLGYRHSLRYVDYFVGAKSRPLAIGDVNVDVNQNNQVSVIDVTRNVQMQRFLNAVNRSGRRLSEYVKSLFGVSQSQDYHEPLYLGHTSDDIVGSSIENTGDAQQSEPLSVTSVLRSNASRYLFEANFDRFSVVIGVTYYDIPRSYFNTVERPFGHVDRFDMFNPDLQFIGDQAIYQYEVNPAVASDEERPFGYTIRNMEYKQRYNQAAGGFVDFLPGYAFLADYDDDRRYLSLDRHIGPSFIRSKNYELDRFYISLTGYSLASYFHFIVDNYNQVSASRPMAWQPGILNS